MTLLWPRWQNVSKVRRTDNSSFLRSYIDVLSFVPVSTIEEVLALDPLSAYPDLYGNVGGTEWRRTTEIASDIYERCPGRAWIRNVTEHASTWKCELIPRRWSRAATLTRFLKQIDGTPSYHPHMLHLHGREVSSQHLLFSAL